MKKKKNTDKREVAHSVHAVYSFYTTLGLVTLYCECVELFTNIFLYEIYFRFFRPANMRFFSWLRPNDYIAIAWNFDCLWKTSVYYRETKKKHNCVYRNTMKNLNEISECNILQPNRLISADWIISPIRLYDGWS